MRKKIFLLVFIFLFCGAFGISGFNFCFSKAEAEISDFSVDNSADVWDGQNVAWNGNRFDSNLDVSADFFRDGKDCYIYSARGFKYFEELIDYSSFDSVNSNIYLETDVDLNNFEWVPIGYKKNFQGNFDGKGHVIYNFKQTKDVGEFGLFGNVSGSIKNLSIDNAQINVTTSTTSSLNVGMLVANTSGNIENCSTEGSVTIENSSANFNVGGLAGQMTGNIYNSFSKVNINLKNTTQLNFGGLAGYSTSTEIFGSYSNVNGALSSSVAENVMTIGGLLGTSTNSNFNSVLSIKNCFSNFDVTRESNDEKGTEKVAGLVGSADSFNVEFSYANFKFQNMGTLMADNISGFANLGNSAVLNINNSFNLLDVNKTLTSVVASFGRTETQNVYTNVESDSSDAIAISNFVDYVKTRGFYSDQSKWGNVVWNFNDTWGIDSGINDCLPYLKNAGSAMKNSSSRYSFNGESDKLQFEGKGTFDDPYKIYTAGDMGRLSEAYRTKQTERFYFSLQNDVDLTSRTFEPIGHSSAFNGIFDGNNHTISGLSCSLQDQFNYHGLFGMTSDAVIKNLILGETRFLNQGTKKTAGNLIGYVAGKTFIINCKDENEIESEGWVDDGIKSFGTIDETMENVVEIYLGKNNINGSELVSSLTANTEILPSGIMVNINSNGGLIYDVDSSEKGNFSNARIYYGEYEILVDNQGKCVNISKGDVSYDESFGSNLLPNQADTWAGDVIRKEGSILHGYKFNTDNSEVVVERDAFISMEAFKIKYINGIYADFGLFSQPGTTEGYVKIQIIYNVGKDFYDINKIRLDKTQWETEINKDANYLKTSVMLGETSVELMLEEDPDSELYKKLYITYELYYGSRFDNYKFLFENQPLVDGLGLRGDDFYIDSYYYKDGSAYLPFDYNSINSVNDDFVDKYSQIYAKWAPKLSEGKGTSYEISVNFVSGQGNISQSVSEDDIKFSVNGVAKKSFLNEGTNYKYGYDLSYLNGNNPTIKLRVSVKNGFSIQNVQLKKVDGKTDTNFGVLHYGEGDITKLDGQEVYDLNKSTEIDFYNFIGNYEFEITIVRSTLSNSLTVGERLFVGLGTLDDVVSEVEGNYSYNIKIKNSSGLFSAYEENMTRYVEQKKAAGLESKIFMSFDVINGVAMAYSEDGEFCEFYEIPDLKLNRIGTIEISIGEKEYIIELRKPDLTDIDQLDKIILRNDDTIIIQFEGKAINGESGDFSGFEYQNMLYESLSSFNIQFAQNFEEEVNFNLSATIDYNASESKVYMNNNNDVQGPDSKKQGIVVFENILCSNDAESSVLGSIFVSIEITSAHFNLPTFYTMEGDEKTTVQKNAPTVHFAGIETDDGANSKLLKKTDADISGNSNEKSIVFFIESSDYFKLSDSNNLINYISTVEFANVGEASQNHEYEENFNVGYRQFFEGATIELFKRGTEGWKGLSQLQYEDDLLQYDVFPNFGATGNYAISNDIYKITLPFNNLLSGKTFILRNGLYNFEFEFEPVFYSADFDVVVLDQNNEVIGGEATKSEIQISAQRFVDSAPISYEKNSEILNLNDRIGFSTQIGRNQGYYFERWEIVNEDTILSAYSRGESLTEGTLDLDFYENYNQSNERYYLDGDNVDQQRYKISVRAVWKAKSVNIKLDDHFAFKDAEQNTLSEFSPQSRNLRFRMLRDGSEHVVDRFQYSKDGNLSPYTIRMSGLDYEAYYLIGYKFGLRELSSKGEVSGWKSLEDSQLSNVVDLQIDDSHVSNSMNSNISDSVKEWIYSGTLDNEDFVYIMPIIAKKTFSVKFYSGAGDGDNSDNQIGDVYDDEGKVTTSDVYVLKDTFDIDSSSVLFGESLQMTKDGESNYTGEVIENIYSTRYGYKAEKNWMQKIGSSTRALVSDQLDVTNQLFRNVQSKSFVVEVFASWTPNNFTLYLDGNGGQINGSVYIEVVFNDVVGKIIDSTNISKSFYNFEGWEIVSATDANSQRKTFEDGNLMFDASGELFEGTFDGFNYIDKQTKKYLFNGDLELRAIWSPNDFSVKVLLNGGKLNSVQDDFVVWDIGYDSTFEEYLDENGDFVGETPSRSAFIYQGVYAIDGSTYQRIYGTTSLNNLILSFDSEAADYCLVLQVRWLFDDSYYDLSFDDGIMSKNLDAREYNGQTQYVYLAEFFDSNVQSKNIQVSTLDKVLQFSQLSDTITIETNVTGDTVSIDKNYFTMKEVGLYYAYITVTLKDNLSEGAILKSFVFTLSCGVSTTQLLLKEKDFSDAYKIQNALRLLEPFVDNETYSQLNKTTSLENFANIYKNYEGGEFESAQGSDIYDYIVVKYYYIITNNDIYQTNFSSLVYKKWTYADFVQAKIDRKEEIDEILEKMKFFIFYQDSADISKLYKSTDLFELRFLNNQDKTPSNVSVDKFVIDSNRLDVNSSYRLKVYIVGDEIVNFDNYEIDDDNGIYLLTDRSCYILPKLLKISNLSENNKTYYSSLNQYEGNVEFEWIGSTKEPVDLLENYKMFYNISDNLYVSLTIHTSNIGSSDVTTDYKFVDPNNFLYVQDVMICSVEDDLIENLSSYYKIVLDKDMVFTILSTKGVSRVNLKTEYLTLDEGGNKSISELEDIEIKVSSVEYFYQGETHNVPVEEIKDGNYSINGLVLFILSGNNSNNLTIDLNLKLKETDFGITSITFATSTMQLGYMGLYKWSDEQLFDIEYGDKMANSDNLVLTSDQITENYQGEGGLIYLYYYLVYTDLVVVQYDYNFPSTYYPNSQTTSYFKLGQTTYKNMYIPNENGFGDAAEMYVVRASQTYEISTIFYGDNGEYIGLKDSNDRYEHLLVEVYWILHQELDYEQILFKYKTSVGTFTSISVYDIVELYNENEELFPDITYKWERDGQSLGDSKRLSLAGGGSASESGRYTLKIDANLSESFYDCLVKGSDKFISCQVEFELEFVKIDLYKIDLPNDMTFENRNFYQDISIDTEMSSYVPTSATEGEMSEHYSSIYYLNSNSLITFKILDSKNQAVTEILDAGTYTIEATINEEMLQKVGDFALTKTFDVLPFEINLEDYALNDFSKKFNEKDLDSLEKYLSIRNDSRFIENINFVFTRQAGEDIGEYKLYFKDFEPTKKSNYIVSYGEDLDKKELFNGEIVAENASVSVGTFNIVKTESLKLQYDITSDTPARIVADYDEDGYTVSINSDNQLNILRGGQPFKTINIKLFDVNTSEVISDSTILSIIKNNFNLNVQFFLNSVKDSIVDVDTYYYYPIFADDGGLSKYFSTVSMSTEYIFEIQPRTISEIDQTKLQKEYDGTNTLYFDIEGNVIDLDSHEGIYVLASFETAHAGENLNVTLSLNSTSGVVNSNYRLETSISKGTITKKDATLTLGFKDGKQTFVYGDVSERNFARVTKNNYNDDFVQILSLHDKEDKDILSLLTEGYYSISLAFSPEHEVRENGYLLKGNYTLKATCEFNDFNLTSEVSDLTFEVTPYTVTKVVKEALYTMTTAEPIQKSYSDYAWVDKTFENVEIEYSIQGYEYDENKPITLSAGSYDFVLIPTPILDGSVIVEIENAKNNGLLVVLETTALYVRLNEDIFSQEYNGKEWTVSVEKSGENYVLNLKNEESGKLSKEIEFFTKKDNAETPVENPQLTEFSITFASSAIKFGNYKFVLTVLSIGDVGYNNLLFDKEYNFSITKRIIKYSTLVDVFEKQFDGNSYVEVESFERKIEGDDVRISGFMPDGDVGGHKLLSDLKLEGRDATNYQLEDDLSGELYGKINKAIANITLSQREFEYGKISQVDGFNFIVSSSNKRLTAGSYELKVDIKDSTYSNSAKKYLNVGQYSVSVTLISDSYDLEGGSANFDVTITKFTLYKTFINDGEFEIEYGTVDAINRQEDESGVYAEFKYTVRCDALDEMVLTTLKREYGEEVGWYKVKDGEYEGFVTSAGVDYNNYLIVVTDKTNLGGVLIKKSNAVIYVLAVDDDGLPVEILDYVYDGKSFNKAEISYVDGSYYVVISNRNNSSFMTTYQLGFFTFEGGEYKKYIAPVKDLSATLSFYDKTILAKNQGTYQIFASNIFSSTNQNVRFGKEASTSAFDFKINKKTLVLSEYYKRENAFNITFDNTSAVYTATGRFEGIVDGDYDKVIITMAYYTGDNYVKEEIPTIKHVGNYKVHFELSGEGKDNYQLESLNIFGQILPATIYFYVNNQYFEYGTKVENSDVEYYYEVNISNFEMEQYDGEFKEPTVEIDWKGAKSGAGEIPVGGYDILVIHEFGTERSDFIMRFVVDRQEIGGTSPTAKINILPKEIVLKQKEGGENLQAIFTKHYDGNAKVDIKDEDGALKFDFDGTLEGDVVNIDSALYSDISVGVGKDVTFNLTGDDSENYYITPWAWGEITATEIEIQFDYGPASQSNVELNNLTPLSKLNYPFSASETLTSNSSDPNSRSNKNFPVFLYGYEGHNFLYWTMNFASSAVFAEGLEGYQMLNADQISWLESVISRLGLKNVAEEEGIYRIKVDNDSLTVKFLDELLGDEENTIGFYYMSESGLPIIKFNSNFTEAEFRVIIQMEDENGRVTNDRGVFKVNDSADWKTAYNNSFSFGQPLIIKVKANPHYRFLSLYVADQMKSPEGLEDGYTKFDLGTISDDMRIGIRFAVQKVRVEIDLRNGGTIDGSLGNFRNDDGKYVWETDYFTLTNFAFSQLPNITKYGYELSKFICTINITNVPSQTSEVVDFSNFLSSCIVQDDDLTLEIVPEFEPQEIEVTFQYYEGKETIVQIKFGQAYSSVSEWSDTEREGYIFEGWLLDGEMLLQDSTIDSVGSKTLTARYQKETYALTVVLENATLTNSSEVFSNTDNTYTLTGVEFGEVVTFVIEAKNGYEFDFDALPQIDGVQFDRQGQNISVTVTMPSHAVSIEVSAEPQTNTVTVQGDNIKSMSYNAGEEDVNFDTSFKIETGKAFSIVVTSLAGYKFDDSSVEIDLDSSLYQINLSKHELTITFSQGVDRDIEISITTSVDDNIVTILFDDPAVIEVVSDTFSRWENSDLSASFTIPTFTVTTGNILELYVKYAHGYVYKDATTDYSVDSELVSEGGYQGYVKLTISNIAGDGNVVINSQYNTFKITLIIKSLDEHGNDNYIATNIVLVDGIECENQENEFEGLYLSRLGLTAEPDESIGYNFAGFSSNGTEIDLSELSQYSYEILGDATIYAIFSISSNVIALNVVEQVVITSGRSGPFVPSYNSVRGGSFKMNDVTIENLEIFYGTNKTIQFVVPDGYYYIGYGYYDRVGNFYYTSQNEDFNSIVDVFITSDFVSNLDLSFRPTISMVVAAYEIKLNVKTMIDINGNLVKDDKVGTAELVAADGTGVNEFGYVENTNIHYFNKDSIDGRDFVVVAYTSNEIYIKANLQRKGYVFSEVKAVNANIFCERTNVEDQIIYRISGLIGKLDLSIDIQVIFKPILNIVDIGFINNGVLSDAGAIEIDGKEFKNQVFVSGSDHSNLRVSAYTDSKFYVTAFIKLGYYVNEIKLNGIEKLDVQIEPYISYNQNKIEQTGYVGEIRFSVSGYEIIHNITIEVLSSTYKVILKQNKTELAEISNVQFNTYLDLSQNNRSNIKIIDDRLRYVGGYLRTIVRENNCNFMGYFSYPDGAGRQYIDSNGESCARFEENGYVLNQITKRYALSDNASYNIVTGDLEISLYVYNSFLKTRFTFELVPKNSDTSITSLDIVTGIDYTNSWFYETQPLNLEVAFGSNIYFNAPKISGYEFYRFVIKQRNASGIWFEDVVSYSDRTLWSTNEMDNFVECRVQIIYFVQVDVRIVGGKANTQITQNDSNIQALLLLEKGYVDVTKPFTIIAAEEEGYFFKSWSVAQTGQTFASKEISLQANNPIVLILLLEGYKVTLNFGTDTTGYDITFGQIERMTITSLDNKSNMVLLGRYSGGKFLKMIEKYEVHVGDEILFSLKIDFGFSAQWENMNVEYLGYENESHLFKWVVDAKFSNQTVNVNPIFKNDIISIYIQRSFASDEILDTAFDLNNVDRAGYVQDQNKKAISFMTAPTQTDIVLNMVLNKRYYVSSLTLVNYDKTFSLTLEDEVISLTKDYMKLHDIFGMLILKIEFGRLYHQNTEILDRELTGSGTEKNPYKIYDEIDLTLMMQLVNSGAKNSRGRLYRECYFTLMANIDLSEKFWTPIGTEENPFDGYFNFNRHKINGLQLAKEYSPIYYDGLFGYLGEHARIIYQIVNYWYIWLIILLVIILLIILIILLIVNRNNKKQREEMAKK